MMTNNDLELKKQISELSEEFILRKSHLKFAFEECKQKVTKWQSSLGESLELTPFENLIPNISNKQSRTLTNPTQAQLKSKRLMKYGFDKNDAPIISIGRPHEDTNKFGELIRLKSDNLILSCQIFTNSHIEDRLLSITKITNNNNSTHYLTVSPPYNWSSRTDLTCQNKIYKSSIMATSWHTQITYNFIYSEAGELEKILIGDHLHWST